MKEIMLASANAHKAQEFEEMLRPLGYTVKTLLDLKEDIEIEETGTTFEENALIKAKAIHERLGIEVMRMTAVLPSMRWMAHRVSIPHALWAGIPPMM